MIIILRNGSLISNIDSDKLVNEIRLKCNDIAWVGVKIKGTNLIIEIKKSTEKPDIIDENRICNIVSNKSGIISKINVQSGTARVNVGDEVEKDTLLVEGIMEGKYTGIRYVNSRADIYAEVTYSKEKSKSIYDIQKSYTGNMFNHYRLDFNNFKINLNKGVSKFEKYDTIETNKKLRLFSNYYLPFQFEKITYKEFNTVNKEYTVEELTNELKTKLEKEILTEIKDKYNNFIDTTFDVNVTSNIVTVKANCKVEEKIGIIQDLVF